MHIISGFRSPPLILQSNFNISPPPPPPLFQCQNMQRSLLVACCCTWCVGAGNPIGGRYKNSSPGARRPLPWPAVNCLWTSVLAKDTTTACVCVCASVYFWTRVSRNSLLTRSWHSDNWCVFFSFKGVTSCISVDQVTSRQIGFLSRPRGVCVILHLSNRCPRTSHLRIHLLTWFPVALTGTSTPTPSCTPAPAPLYLQFTH